MDPCDSSSDVSSGVEMSDVALNAIILVPSGTWLPPGEVEVSGWALGPNTVPVTDVECSGDGGITWTDATVYETGSPWTWRLWRATLNLATGSLTLVVRCTDARGVTQPAELDEVWNVKGYGNNAWHRVPVEVE